MTNENRVRATAVIPAYNEADHIERVLRPLSSIPVIQQVIVVDDGSVDDTAGVVCAYARHDARVQLVRLPQNVGKGGALLAGIHASSTDLVVLLDADLLHLRGAHVEALIAPVWQRRCAMTLGIFENGRQQTNLSHRLFSFLSGQRCLRWPAFQRTAALHASALDDTRWGIEMALNLVAWQQKLTVQHVPWDGVSHTMRLEKLPGPRKYWTYVEMWADILRCTATVGFRLWRENGRAPKRPRPVRHMKLSD
ncbi:MAG: glycosyltransferase family 2 protein [Anaerolineales bacterium]|nr:glycosyltransferase family 2 protein [Anaerolineales bacterium]